MIVSIIIPVYNEFRTLPQVLQRVREARLPAGIAKEIIIVDDGSTDGTEGLLSAWAADSVLIHHHAANFGKGAAIRLGLSKARGDIVLIQDGDLEYDPNDYMRLVAPIVEGREKIVYGSRFHSPLQGRVPGMERRNRVANSILTLTANTLYGAGITDEATAYKAFHIDVLRRLRLECRRFEFCPEVTAKIRRLGYTIYEVPISYNPRGIAEGKKIAARDGFHAMWTLLRYRLQSRRSFEVIAKAAASA